MSSGLDTGAGAPRGNRVFRLRWAAVLIGSAVLLHLLVVIRCAWVSDDAYITLRTVDNFVRGRGLVWNANERVQTYTHPLWLLLLSGAYRLTHEAYYTTIAVGLLISLATVSLVAAQAARNLWGRLLAVVLLTTSKSYVDYSTSGLENPLTHLWLVLFAMLYLNGPAQGPRLMGAALLAGLAAFNRLDTVLLFVPPLLWALIQRPIREGMRAAAVGTAPIAAWLLFALWYYGFPFPNTAYAKLGNGVPWHRLCGQGLRYLLVSAYFDPVLALTMSVAALGALCQRDGRRIAWAGGMLLYTAYVVWLGGDFMAGRFLTPPFLMAVLLVGACPLPRARWTWAGLALFVALSAMRPYTPLWSGARYRGAEPSHLFVHRFILDERGGYHAAAGLMARQGRSPWPQFTGRRDAEEARRLSKKVVVKGNVGYFGFAVGHDVHVVDYLGLTDPLLARLPPVPKPYIRPGHFEREIPAGYYETLEAGVNRIADPGLAEYYEHLCVLTRGSLWDRRRWVEIWKMNAGRYRDLLAGLRRPAQAAARDAL